MRVLVIPAFHGFIYQVCEFITHLEIGKALAKVYRIVFNGKLAHHGKNGSAYVGKFGLQLYHAKDLSRKYSSGQVFLRGLKVFQQDWGKWGCKLRPCNFQLTAT